MVKEVNRAVEQLALFHGDSFKPDSLDPEVLVAGLIKKGYVDDGVLILNEVDPLEWHDGRLRSVSYPDAISTTHTLEVSFPMKFLSRALYSEEEIYVRLFSLRQIQTRLKEKIPLRALLKGISRERHEFLIEIYVQLLSSSYFYQKIPSDAAKKLPESFRKFLKQLAQDAATRPQKARALFLNILLSDFQPVLEIRTLMYCMDHEYPSTFLHRVFQLYPQTYLESFIEPFEKGFGNQFLTLLELFAKSPQNPKILDTLYHALIHREEGHFSFYQSAIIQTWEDMSEISFSGDDTPFRNWYKNNRDP